MTTTTFTITVVHEDISTYRIEELITRALNVPEVTHVNIKPQVKSDVVYKDIDYTIDECKTILTTLGITFTSHNFGLHLILVMKEGNKIDFWPTTSKWVDRNNAGRSKVGFKILLQHIGIDKKLYQPLLDARI